MKTMTEKQIKAIIEEAASEIRDLIDLDDPEAASSVSRGIMLDLLGELGAEEVCIAMRELMDSCPWFP